MVFFVPILFILCKLQVIDLKLMLLIVRSNRRNSDTIADLVCFYQRIYFVVAYICGFFKHYLIGLAFMTKYSVAFFALLKRDLRFHIYSLGKTHIKQSVFFRGRTTKGVGRVNPPDH